MPQPARTARRDDALKSTRTLELSYSVPRYTVICGFRISGVWACKGHQSWLTSLRRCKRRLQGEAPIAMQWTCAQTVQDTEATAPSDQSQRAYACSEDRRGIVGSRYSEPVWLMSVEKRHAPTRNMLLPAQTRMLRVRIILRTVLLMQTSACAHAQLSAPKFCYRPTMLEHSCPSAPTEPWHDEGTCHERQERCERQADVDVRVRRT